MEDPSSLTESERGRLVETEDGELFVCRDEDFEREMDYLKKKIDAGADLIITQVSV